MATLLKRLSINLERKPQDGTGNRTLTSVASFSDFSAGCAQDADDHPVVDMASGGVHQAPCAAQQNGEFRTSPFIVGSAPAGASAFSSLPKTAALRIPRSPVAHLLSQRSMGPGADSGTPRSSLDMPAGSAPTPRGSIFGTPRSSLGGLGASDPSDVPASPRSPRSPSSPTTPGGRRRKSQKIDGMDYYEFCELIRSSSL